MSSDSLPENMSVEENLTSGVDAHPSHSTLDNTSTMLKIAFRFAFWITKKRIIGKKKKKEFIDAEKEGYFID